MTTIQFAAVITMTLSMVMRAMMLFMAMAVNLRAVGTLNIMI